MGQLHLISWNINQRMAAWQALVHSDADVALLQEAKFPPPDLTSRTVVARLSDRVTMRPRQLGPLGSAQGDQLAVSRMGTLAVANIVVAATGEVITVVSMYGAWETPLQDTASRWIYADASVHRLISDLSTLISHQRAPKLIAAGDLNILYGYGERGSVYWQARYDTIFARMAALGLPFVGPQAPEGGDQAQPWPDELPRDSRNVPTFRTRLSQPETATRQLDFVFASVSLRDRLQVRALNRPDEWGLSDHCRLLIELET